MNYYQLVINLQHSIIGATECISACNSKIISSSCIIQDKVRIRQLPSGLHYGYRGLATTFSSLVTQPPKRTRKGVWQHCVQRVVAAECNNCVLADLRFKFEN